MNTAARNLDGGRFPRTRLFFNRRANLRALLVASLLLNAFLIGTLVAGMLSPAPERRRGPLSIEVSRVVEALPADSREEVRRSVEDIMPQLRERWAKLRDLRAELAVLVGQDDPDRIAIDAHLAEIRTINTEIQRMVQQQLYESVLGLPTEERRLIQNQENVSAK